VGSSKKANFFLVFEYLKSFKISSDYQISGNQEKFLKLVKRNAIMFVKHQMP